MLFYAKNQLTTMCCCVRKQKKSNNYVNSGGSSGRDGGNNNLDDYSDLSLLNTNQQQANNAQSTFLYNFNATRLNVLLVFPKEDAQYLALKVAIQKCGYLVKLVKDLDETCNAFVCDEKYDLVFVDCRDTTTTNSNTTTATTVTATTYSQGGAQQQQQSLYNSTDGFAKFDYENICKSIRKLYNYSVIVALTKNYDDRQVPSVLPFLKCGFNRTFSETTNINRIMNELLTYEYGDIGNMQRLQAAHSLFTALEYTNDPVEIMNDHFKLLYVNNAYERLTGFTLEEITGKDFAEIHKTDPNIHTIKEQISKGYAWEGQLNFRRSSGDSVSQLTKSIPVLLNGGKLHNYVNITYLNASQTNATSSPSTTPSPIITTQPQTIQKIELKSSVSLPVTKDVPLNQQPAQQEPDRNVLPFDFNAQSSQRYNLNQRKRSYEIKSNALFDGLQFARRHSSARVHTLNVEAPINKVINLILQAYDKCTTDTLKQTLERALDVLRSTELYNPITLHDNDKHTNALVSGLMSNGSMKKNSKSDIFPHRTVHATLSTTSIQNFLNNLSAEVSNLLETEINWNFDILTLERLTLKRPLLTLGLKVMNRFNVCEYLKCDETVLVNWLTLMESNYKQTNTYHNSTHASDVLHATAYFLTTNKLSEILDNVDKVGSLLAAAIHDLNHPGRTNAFLCNSDNSLAILYNDQAVLENHHAALAFQLTHDSENANIFKNLTRDEYRALRTIIIDMVLATEMSKHFEHLNKFVNKFCDNEATQPIVDEENQKAPENKTLIKRILIKCADVSNPCRPLYLCKDWALRIAQEYFEQTDDEKSRGLPVVMPIFDRTSCNIPKAQLSFIEYFITDMFEAWHEFINIKEVMHHLEKNTVYWRDSCEQEQTKAGRAGSIKEDDDENS